MYGVGTDDDTSRNVKERITFVAVELFLVLHELTRQTLDYGDMFSVDNRRNCTRKLAQSYIDLVQNPVNNCQQQALVY